MMKLAIGPLRYYWPREATLQFYAGLAAAPVDVVYLGETVCSRRHELRWEDWLDVAEMLADAGKEVVLSTLTVVEAEADLRLLRRIAGQTRFRVEANDMGAVHLLEGRPAGPRFVAGASLNVWSARTLDVVRRAGAGRWVAPPEMSAPTLRSVLRDAGASIETEVLVHGHLPLAHSARCFTARHYDLQKDQCEYRCLGHAEGLPLQTREGQPFLVLNGVETQSAGVYTLLAELPALAASGVDVVRVSPQADGTAELIDLFRAALDGTMAPRDAAQHLQARQPAGRCNGFWHGRPGAELVAAASGDP